MVKRACLTVRKFHVRNYRTVIREFDIGLVYKNLSRYVSSPYRPSRTSTLLEAQTEMLSVFSQTVHRTKELVNDGIEISLRCTTFTGNIFQYGVYLTEHNEMTDLSLYLTILVLYYATRVQQKLKNGETLWFSCIFLIS